MATIQIRDIPQDAYDTIRRRAEEHGQSLQAYMRDQVIEFARRQTKAEALAAIRAAHERWGGAEITADEIAAMIREDRERR